MNLPALPSLPSIISTQPTVLITGFLGAGKTTLLREILIASKKQNLAVDVILNDYADATLDRETLKEFTDNVEPLNATCACCEGLDFLLELSVKSSKSSSDLLLIELNGTADPVPVVESFTLLEEKLKLHPRWQLCVIDVRHFGDRGAYRDIEELQLQTASHIYLSHHDPQAPIDSVIEEIKKINPYASILDKDTLIKQIITLAQRKSKQLITQQPSTNQLDLTSAKQTHQNHQSHDFTACQILMPPEAAEETIKEWLAALPANVMRVKLLIGVTDRKKDRYLFEKVGSEISRYPQNVRLNSSVPNSAILIGPDLNTDQLQTLAQKHLGQPQ